MIAITPVPMRNTFLIFVSRDKIGSNKYIINNAPKYQNCQIVPSLKIDFTHSKGKFINSSIKSLDNTNARIALQPEIMVFQQITTLTIPIHFLIEYFVVTGPRFKRKYPLDIKNTGTANPQR